MCAVKSQGEGDRGEGKEGVRCGVRGKVRELERRERRGEI